MPVGFHSSVVRSATAARGAGPATAIRGLERPLRPRFRAQAAPEANHRLFDKREIQEIMRNRGRPGRNDLAIKG